MGKGNGATRTSSSRSPRGIADSSTSSNSDMLRIEKLIDKKGFIKDGEGKWDLVTPYGGAMILEETSSVSYNKEYGVSAWDANFEMIENGQERHAKRFTSLNEAKRYAKELLINKLK